MNENTETVQNELRSLALKDRIKFIRMQREMTRKELASLTGISESAIQKYELGIRVPKIDALHKIADVLDINVNYLYIPELNNVSDSEKDKFHNISEKNTSFYVYLNSLGYEVFSFPYCPTPDTIHVYSKLKDNDKEYYLPPGKLEELQSQLNDYIDYFLHKYNKDPNE